MSYKSPINWFGGKYYMANKIIDIFPPHKFYVEVFGGAGHVLFKKKPSEVEVFNDLNKDLYLFFKTLRDSKKSEELIFSLQMTPHSRTEFENCYNCWEGEKDEVERVRKWYVALMQCYSAGFGNSSWSFSKSISRRNMSQATSKWLNKVDKDLPKAVDRLSSVQIENRDYEYILKKYDSKESLFYCDPPYIHDTRKMSYKYANEMSDEDHLKLVNTLMLLKGKVVLSGYEHPIYESISDKNGWRKIFIGDYDKKSMNHNAKTEKGKEFVWVNF